MAQLLCMRCTRIERPNESPNNVRFRMSPPLRIFHCLLTEDMVSKVGELARLVSAEASATLAVVRSAGAKSSKPKATAAAGSDQSALKCALDMFT